MKLITLVISLFVCCLMAFPMVGYVQSLKPELTENTGDSIKNPQLLIGGNIIEHHQGEVEDGTPYDVYKINGSDTTTWLENNFNDDVSLPVHYLSNTLQQVTTVDGKLALVFKSIEYDALIQNILVQMDKENLNLYRILAEKDSIILNELIGFVPNENPSASQDAKQLLGPTELKAVASSPPSSCQNNSYKFGAKIGDYNGVPAYSNCKSDFASYQYNIYSGYQTGMKWQCVEYVARYFKAKFNRQVAGGNANSYCGSTSKKLNKAENGKTTNKPQPGNIICSNGGKYGHCAIVRAVGSNYVQVIEQNFNNSNKDANQQLSLTKNSNGTYKVGGFSSTYPVKCWMWPK